MSQWLLNEQFGNGSDGAVTLSGTDAPIDSSCSGTSGSQSLSATNASFAANQIILIHQSRGTGAGQWELNVIASYTAGTITCKYPLSYTYTDSGASQAQVLVMKQYTTATFNSTLTTKAWDGNVGGITPILAQTLITANSGAVLDADGGPGKVAANNVSADNKGGFRGGSSATNNSQITSWQGEGTGGAGSQSTSANGNGGGGATSGTSNGQYAVGGSGGNGTSGDNGWTDGSGPPVAGTKGSTAGSADLSTMVFGGGSGGLAQYLSGGTSTQNTGANGGGIVMLFAPTVTLTNLTIQARGSEGNGNGASGSGAGGGSVLVKGININLGTNTVATGGVIGSGQAAGGTGRVAVYAPIAGQVTGTTNPTYTFTADNSFSGGTQGFIS